MLINKVDGAVIQATLNKKMLSKATSVLSQTTVEEFMKANLSETALQNEAVAAYMAENGHRKLTKALLDEMRARQIITDEQYLQYVKQLGASMGDVVKQLATSPMVITMIATTLTGLINKFKTVKDKTDELKESYDNLRSAISGIEGEINSLDSELDNLQEKINELQNQDSLSLTDAKELQSLREQSAELERQKELQEQILKAREKQDQSKSMTMIDNVLATKTANQEQTANTGASVGKAVGTIAAAVATLAIWAAAIAEPTPAGEAAAAPATAAIWSGLKTLGVGKSMAIAMGAGQVGGALGEKIGGSVSKTMAADSLIEWYESYEKAITQAQQQATQAESKYLSNMTDKNYNKWQKKVEAVNTLQTEMYDGLEEMQSYINNLEYNAETAGIIDGYNELMTHIDVKANGDNVDSQISSIEALKAEYESLSKGVDANGKNIALSAQEYSRYCSIIDQVLGYTPGLIQGYNDEGEAIFNRNSLIQDSIDLLKEAQRLEAIKLVDDATILSAYDGVKENVNAQKKIKLDKNISGDFLVGLEDLIGKEQTLGQSDEKYILENLDIIKQKWTQVLELANQTNGQEFADALRSDLQEVIVQLQYAEGSMLEFQQRLAVVPKTSIYYDNLSGEHISFINGYIQTFDNLSDLTEDEILRIRDSIFMLTETIGSSDTAQQLISALFDVDDSISAQGYANSINEILSQMVDGGLIDDNVKNKLFAQFVPDAENVNTMLDAIGGKLSNGLDKLQGLSLAELKIAYKIVADTEPGSMTFAELKTKITELSSQNQTISVQSLSAILDKSNELNDIIGQTAEIVVNNTKVTQEYKDALVELVGSEEKVNEYFDQTNSLVVADAQGLNKLLQTTKKNAAANTSLAKTQARMQYYELYKELKTLVGGQKVTNVESLKHINTLRQEMNALESVIAKYSIFEAQLLGATSAYEKFAKAQEADAQTDIVSSAEDMVLALGQAFDTAELGTETAKAAIDGLVPESVYADLETVDEKMAAISDYFKTGKIAQYFRIEYDDDGAIESAEMKLGNLRKFIEDGLSNGVFTGTDWRHFELSDSIESLEDFAKQMGVTEEVAFAFLKTLEDHDTEWLNGDYTSLLENLLPKTLENDIYQTITSLADLEVQLANGEITADEYAQKLVELSEVSQQNSQKAREGVDSWLEANEELTAAKTTVEQLTSELSELKENGATDAEIAIVTDQLESAQTLLSDAADKIATLEEPTEMVFQVALENAQAEIDAFEKENSELLAKVSIEQNADGEHVYEVNAGIVLDDNEKQLLADYVSDLNSQHAIELFMGEGTTSPIEQQLDDIKQILQDSYNVLNQNYNNTDVSDKKQSIASVFENITPEISSWWDNLVASIGEFFSDLGTPILNGFENALSYITTKMSTFFTETIPAKWDEFWGNVGEKFEEVKENATILKENIVTFFTETIPEKWDEFWDEVEKFFSEDIPYATGYAAGTVKRFFTDIIPEKWDEFWQAVKNKFAKIKEYAGIIKNKIVLFFTETLPQKWDEFWNEVGAKLEEFKEQAVLLKDKLVTFFTVTILEKWNAFWDEVGVKIEELKQQAVLLKDKVVDFFTVTIPEKWAEFWEDVGVFFGEIIPQAYESIKTGITTFFTETIPQKFNELWDNVGIWISEKISSIFGSFSAGFEAGESGANYNPSGVHQVNGTAHASGNWGLPTSEHNALVGELGTELVVDPQSGRYYTVGNRGAEMVDLPKGAIIFNHKQTKSLLENGYVTSRGKAYAEGNAHVTIWPNASSKNQWEGTGYSSWDDPTYDLNEALSSAADSVGEFEETIDWIEIRMEELNDALSLYSAKMENAASFNSKNDIVDQMIAVNKDIIANANAGAEYYQKHADKYLSGMSDELVLAAKNGSITITEFTKEQDEATVNAINKYREFTQKAADLTTQAIEAITEIRDLAKQKFDNISEAFDNITDIRDHQKDKIDDAISLMEELGNVASSAYYDELIKHETEQLKHLNEERTKLINSLNESVKNGDVEVGDTVWYEMQSQIYDVDHAIDECTSNLEEYQNAINDIYWDNFDELINRFDYIRSETESLIKLLEHDDLIAEPSKRTYKGGTEEYWTADDVELTKEGVATLGLYAQQMELAEYEAKQYGEAIEKLTADYKKGLYSESEYYEKLNELTEAQYDSIESYHDAKDAIVDLNKERIESVKDGIDKEIDAYSELIDKKKELLENEKDLYDFQKGIQEQQKDIASIQRKLAALANDNSASAIAQRKKLEAELAEANAQLEETYYDRSIENQQNALDKSLDSFKEEKEAEKEAWDKYLEDIEVLVADSLKIIAGNAEEIGNTLTGKAEEYNITISEAILTPWQTGAGAISEYTTAFGDSSSATLTQLDAIKNKWQEIIDKMLEAAKIEITSQQKENSSYSSATKKEPEKTTPAPSNASNKTQAASTPKATPSVGSTVTVKTSATHFSANSGNLKMASFVPGGSYTVYETEGDQVLIGKNGVYTGWVKKTDLQGYAKGTTSLNKSGLITVDELGEELVLGAHNGRITYAEKGTGIIPADITSNLMSWGELNPQEMLERNRPTITTSHIANNEINISMDIAEVVHIDKVTNDTIPNLTKAIEKQMDAYVVKLNNSLKRFSR